nr:MAG TPA: Protein of unknown function (DUF722) [Caudoviricetes sp.]
MADDYCEIARNYLKPICRYRIRIDVLKERIETLKGDLYTLRAVDYSKERLSGGGTPSGIDGGIATLVDAESAALAEMAELVTRKETAVSIINELPDMDWKNILTHAYVNGYDNQEIADRISLSVDRVKQLRREALYEFGIQLKKRTKTTLDYTPLHPIIHTDKV